MPKRSSLENRILASRLVHSEGKSISAAARQLGVTRKTVRRWVKRQGIIEKLRSGRPRKTAKVDDDNLERLTHDHPSATSKELTDLWGEGVDPSTTRRRLIERGLFARRPTHKPLLTSSARKVRLAWAKVHASCKFSNVLWSDEVSIPIIMPPRFVRRRSGETGFIGIHPHPIKLNFWACIGPKGVGKCFVYKRALNQNFYRKILRRCLARSAEKVCPRSWIFMQDNLAAHKTRKLKRWFSRHKIRLLDWPPYSPDLNPIENIWRLLKQRVAARKCKTIVELRHVIREEWKSIPTETVKNVIASIPRRLKEVIANDGGWTDH